MAEEVQKKYTIHPMAAAAIGAAVGVVGGVAAYSLSQDPDMRQKAKKSIAALKQQAQKKLEILSNKAADVTEKASETLEE